MTVSPTLCDSTIAQGMCWSAFFVRAHTPEPLIFFDTAVDSGYSVDNLAPAAPGDLHFTGPTTLAWAESPEEDFNYFSICGSVLATFDSTASLLGQTTSTTWDVSVTPMPFYHVTATDFSGNEGEASTIGSSTRRQNTLSCRLMHGPVPARDNRPPTCRITKSDSTRCSSFNNAP